MLVDQDYNACRWTKEYSDGGEKTVLVQCVCVWYNSGENKSVQLTPTTTGRLQYLWFCKFIQYWLGIAPSS